MPSGVYQRTEEHGRKIGDAHRGRTLTEEHKKKMSITRLRRKERLGYLNSPETRKKIGETVSRTRKGMKFTEEHKESLRTSWMHTRDARIKRLKDGWAGMNEEDRAARIEKLVKYPSRIKISKSQRALYEMIKKVYPNAILEHSIRTNHSYRFADIALVDQKIDIEFDGKYWHKAERDRIRDEQLKEIGWKTVRIAPSMLHDEAMIIEMVKENG